MSTIHADLDSKSVQEIEDRIEELDEVEADPYSGWDIASGRRADIFCGCAAPDGLCEWDDSNTLWAYAYLAILEHRGVGVTQ